MFGRRCQKDYQGYEEQRLAKGAAVEDRHFYDDFDAAHAPIASPVGNADLVLSEPMRLSLANPLPAAVLGAAVFAYVTAHLMRRASGHREIKGSASQ